MVNIGHPNYTRRNLARDFRGLHWGAATLPDFTVEWLPTDERDRALGRYMDAFSRLEGMIAHATMVILGLDDRASAAISATVMTKQSIDLLEASAKLHFAAEGSARVTKICQRLGRRNMRRNHLVHGKWQMVVTIGDDGMKSEWVRKYDHIDPDRQGMRPDDPALIGTYNFTIPALDSATEHVEEMVLEMSALCEDIEALRLRA